MRELNIDIDYQYNEKSQPYLLTTTWRLPHGINLLLGAHGCGKSLVLNELESYDNVLAFNTKTNNEWGVGAKLSHKKLVSPKDVEDIFRAVCTHYTKSPIEFKSFESRSGYIVIEDFSVEGKTIHTRDLGSGIHKALNLVYTVLSSTTEDIVCVDNADTSMSPALITTTVQLLRKYSDCSVILTTQNSSLVTQFDGYHSNVFILRKGNDITPITAVFNTKDWSKGELVHYFESNTLFNV